MQPKMTIGMVGWSTIAKKPQMIHQKYLLSMGAEEGATLKSMVDVIIILSLLFIPMTMTIIMVLSCFNKF